LGVPLRVFPSLPVFPSAAAAASAEERKNGTTATRQRLTT